MIYMFDDLSKWGTYVESVKDKISSFDKNWNSG